MKVKVVKEFIAHPIIQTALVLGACTIILAYFSKRVLAEPLSNLELGLPALLGMLFQGMTSLRKTKIFYRPWIGMLIIAASTALIILINMR